MPLITEMYLLSCVIHMFHTDEKYVKMERGVKLDSIYMSYRSIYDDVDTVVNWMHQVSLQHAKGSMLIFHGILTTRFDVPGVLEVS